MNDQNDQDQTPDDGETARPDDRRPLGYWLRVVDALLARELAAALDAEGISRRDWMALNVLSGDVDAPGMAERLARKGKRLRVLEERGWVQEHGDGSWTLTDLGRAEKDRVGAIVDGIRSRVTGAVGDEAYAALTGSLEAIARELGWDAEADERDRRSAGFGRAGFEAGSRPGFAPGFRSRGFGPRFGPGSGLGFRGRPQPFGPDIHAGYGPNLHRGFAPGRPGHPAERFDEPLRGEGDDGCHGHHPYAGHSHRDHESHHDHGGHHGHEHGGHHGREHRGGRRTQRAYERGFDAGFARGREAGAA
ncbi:hypothetical protein [Microbacterium atlanticum]|uniref:hypothetical protein n=1 Tax=Microbacterium atlanticum TaxID=2782168 RepID=UPI0018872B46|nr:hypothetical protein [Microbacterium atlanticum]